MDAPPVVHPSLELLQGFGLGKLDNAVAERVLAHLETCLDCRNTVAGISGDSFLQRVRAARPSANTQPEAHGPGDTAATPGPVPLNIPRPTAVRRQDIPAEFRDHPQYEVLFELDRGGMGVVYLARDKFMDRKTVLKVVNKKFFDRPEVQERFLREIRLAAQLSHPNIVAAYAALPVGEMIVFAMEYIEGENLATFVQRTGPLPVVNAGYYALQVAQGLQHAFEKGLVHRDIKPQNLILTRQGKKHLVKILDFGLAKAKREQREADTGLTGSGVMVGTPDYIAPEQTLDASRADIRADIYSLGCTLYFLLAGRPPFQAASIYELLQAHQQTQATPLDRLRPEVPRELAAVAAKMMAKQPGQRYQKPAEVVEALKPFLKGTPKALPPAPPTAPKSGTVAGTSQVDPGRRAAPVPRPTVIEGPATGARQVKPAPAKPGTTRSRKWLLVPLVGLLLAGLIGLWAGDVFRSKTTEGTQTPVVRVTNPDPKNPDPEPNKEPEPNREEVVIYPASGQKAVPLVFPGDEDPNPIPDAGAKSAGFPVTITFAPGQTVTQVEARLVGPSENEVPSWLSSPERPANPGFVREQQNTVCLIARQPLLPNATYTIFAKATVANKAWERRWQFTTTPAAEAPEAVGRLLEKINVCRRLANLSLLPLNQDLSKACGRHAVYVARYLNVQAELNLQDEEPTLTGFTEEGRQAAKRSAIKIGHGLDAALEELLASPVTREALLNPDLKSVGLGLAFHPTALRIWVIDLAGDRARNQPDVSIVYPADRQADVPLAIFANTQPPLLPPAVGTDLLGYPITVRFAHNTTVAEVTAKLLRESTEEEVRLLTPEKSLPNQIGLVPSKPLTPNAEYKVAVAATVAGKSWRREWSFRTAADQDAGREATEKKILDEVNQLRREAGLSSVVLDSEFSGSCYLHARYLSRNAGEDPTVFTWEGGHRETPGKPGYSEQGHKAAERSLIVYSGDPTDAVELWKSTLYHRIPLLRHDLKKIGFGYVRLPTGQTCVVLDVQSDWARVP